MRLLACALTHPLAFVDLPWVAAYTAAKSARPGEKPELVGESDPELRLGELRANWMLRDLAKQEHEQAVSRFVTALDQARTTKLGAYSRSQRICNFVYLARSLARARRDEVLARVLPAMHEDAAYLRVHPEFRLNGPWFNNHLLNNYRAAVLYQSHFAATDGGHDLRSFIDRIGRILGRNRATLFGTGGALLEGSVSYEILGAKHLLEIACCDQSGPLKSFARESVLAYRWDVDALYRKEGTWLLPDFGDHSPDWERADISLFLDAYVLGTTNVYRRIWQEELAALGL
jgi:hypothetical protein